MLQFKLPKFIFGCALPTLMIVFDWDLKKLFECDIMDVQDFHQASDRNVGFTIFNPPVVHSWDVVIICKAFVTGVTLPSPQLGKLDANTLKC